MATRTRTYMAQRGLTGGIRKPAKGQKPGKSRAKGYSPHLTPKQRRRVIKKGH